MKKFKDFRNEALIPSWLPKQGEIHMANPFYFYVTNITVDGTINHLTSKWSFLLHMISEISKINKSLLIF